MYSVKDNNIIKNKNYFHKLHCLQISPEIELIFINLNKSKWFFDLKNAWRKLKNDH